MAVSEGQSALLSWKSSFPTAIRKDENACQDIFQNSEKLLASAVSICRLKGSVECQTGGLITVCEELQSLIRLAFSEMRRVEKDFRYQKTSLENEISHLRERVKHLEKENSIAEPSKQRSREFLESERKPREVVANNSPSNDSLPVSETNIQGEDIFTTDGTEIIDIPLENASSLKEQNVTLSLQEKKSNSRKRLKLPILKKAVETSKPVKDSNSNPEELSLDVKDDDGKVMTGVKEKSNTVPQEALGEKQRQVKHATSSKNVEALEKAATGDETLKSKGIKRGNLRRKKTECTKQETMTAVKALEESKVGQKEDITETRKTKPKCRRNEGSLQDELLSEDDVNQEKDISEMRKDQKQFQVTTESKEATVFSGSVEESLDVHVEAEMIPGGKKKDFTVKKKTGKKTSKRLLRNEKSMRASGDCTAKTNVSEMPTDEYDEEFKEIALTPNSEPQAKNVKGKMPSISNQSTATKDCDEPLGDMSFLIEVNSKISLFVSDVVQDECELDPMTARQRNEVYKVAQLYKLRARIGSKADNNLTTVRLSKQGDTQMPKAGKVDRLLSELSIAASKEAFKESPKIQSKRKHGATADRKKASDDNDIDQQGPPKKKFAKQSRSKQN
ncbi:M protein, serotype 5-like isoform X2 [Montipora capricornis]|uniref:M protein, serotype 5-like isoform X2 n=1 Tax=Montipora capricornis TaxID=246305 RepID=UPI0035F216D7